LAPIPASLLRMFAPIEGLLTDPSVRRVFVDGPGRVFAERHGRVERVDAVFGPEALEAALEGLARRAGKVFDAARPSLEARLKDGTRFVALRSPAVADGPVLAVVRPGGRTIDLLTMVRQGSLPEDAASLLAAAVAAGLNIAVVGPPGSGRTSFTEALASAVPGDGRIGVLEEFPELRLPGRVPVRLVPTRADAQGRGGVSVGDLLYCAGRLGLDRLLLGTVRWQDAWDAASVLARRAVPVILTLPGLGGLDAIARFEAVARAGAAGPRERAVPGLLGAGLDLVVALGGRPGARRVVAIDRVRPAPEGPRLVPLWAADPDDPGRLAAVDPEAIEAMRAACRAWGHVAGPLEAAPHVDLDDEAEADLVEVVTEANASLPPGELMATQDGMEALRVPPAPRPPPPLPVRPARADAEGDEDEEATMITDVIEPAPPRGEVLSTKTFSQVLRTIGAESGENTESVDRPDEAWPLRREADARRTNEMEAPSDASGEGERDESASEEIDLEPVLRGLLSRRRGDRNTAVHSDEDPD
jgi:type IV secretory pathway ATPase VirB11/archaellum biosynthesis ATPase